MGQPDTLIDYFETKEEDWEKLCRHCGGCCGRFDDPCEHLRIDGQGRSSCAVYADRLGTHKTVKGEEFTCVSVRRLLNAYWKNDNICAYKRR